MVSYGRRLSTAFAVSALVNISLFSFFALSPSLVNDGDSAVPMAAPILIGLSGSAISAENSVLPDIIKTEQVVPETMEPEISKKTEIIAASVELPGPENYSATNSSGQSDGSPVQLSSMSSQAVPVLEAGKSTALQEKNPRKDFLVFLYNLIAETQEYPGKARQKMVEGTVVLKLLVEADGELSSCSVVQSSGSSMLDRAARRLLQGLFPVSYVPGEYIDCTVAVTYTLN